MNPYDKFASFFQNYSGISALLKQYCYEEIVEIVPELLHAQKQPIKLSNEFLTTHYKQTVTELIQNILEYDVLYETLSDEISKLTLLNIMIARLLPDSFFFQAAIDPLYPPFCDAELLQQNHSLEKVMVSCGTVHHCQDVGTQICHIYGGMQLNLIAQQNMIFHPNILGHTISLDIEIQQPISCIKLDLDGKEMSVLYGAKQHIQQECPSLALAAYHKQSHVWEFPKFIRQIQPKYRFFLRQYPYQTVLYATVPSQQHTRTIHHTIPQ